MKNQGKGTISVFCAIILIVLTCCTGLAGAEQTPTFKYPYGVFLSICENIEQFADYEIVVIDAQYYPKEELDAFRSKGHKVFSYINIGSLEDFRDYYDEYKDLSLGAYEHWEEEVWVDVSQKRWQEFMLNDIAAGTKASVTAFDWIGLLFISFVLPAVICPCINIVLNKIGWVRKGDLKLD